MWRVQVPPLIGPFSDGWELSTDSEHDVGDSIEFELYLNRFDRHLTDAETIDVLDSHLKQAGVAWLKPRGGRWELDLDELRREFSPFKDLTWLRGVVPTQPEVDVRQAEVPINGNFDHYVHIRLDRGLTNMSSDPSVASTNGPGMDPTRALQFLRRQRTRGASILASPTGILEEDRLVNWQTTTRILLTKCFGELSGPLYQWDKVSQRFYGDYFAPPRPEPTVNNIADGIFDEIPAKTARLRAQLEFLDTCIDQLEFGVEDPLPQGDHPLREVPMTNEWPRITPRQEEALFHLVEWEQTGERSFIHTSTHSGSGIAGHDEEIERSDLEQLAAKGYLHQSFGSSGGYTVSVTAEGHHYYDERKDVTVTRSSASSDPHKLRHVFVVHGHDEARRDAVALFLGRVGLVPIVLQDKTSRGRTIVEKFEDHAAEAGFAVVLMTGDDIGGVKSDPPASLKPRARQNVIFELGYFSGKLGRGNVCALHESGVEIPSDYQGVVYIPLDPNGAWRLTLAREMRDAGLPADLNRI
jgi:predicted nucleotide-binding protein